MRLATFIIASLTLATSATAGIGDTRAELLQKARRDKNITYVRTVADEDGPMLTITYRDGSYTSHTFGPSRRVMRFYLSPSKQLTRADAAKIQRMYPGTWRSTGDDDYGFYNWESSNGLEMCVHPERNFLIIDNQEFREHRARVRGRSIPRVAPYEPEVSSNKNDCLIVATEALDRLKKTSAWARIAGFNVSKIGGSIIGGHAVVLFQPAPSASIWMYDSSGSRDLHTTSHDLGELAVALNQQMGPGYCIKNTRWVDNTQ